MNRAAIAVQTVPSNLGVTFVDTSPDRGGEPHGANWCPVIGLPSPEQVDDIVRTAANDRPLSEGDHKQLTDELPPMIVKGAEESRNGPNRLFWLHDTTVMGWHGRVGPVAVSCWYSGIAGCRQFRW